MKCFYFQAFVADLLLTVAGGFASRPSIFSYSKLGVTIGWKGKVNVPLIFGSPYLTFALNAETPIFLTPHPVISVTPNEQKTKHRVVLGNGQVRKNKMALNPSYFILREFSCWYN